eukprot:CAMPEP_0198206714 /NCGR_PEP_ID=MMETSP1445-20131203/10245_1 /TAXON_ID=36898 /ORGANISM="Pyramimonas sp., Strain CCMP2087" /LENGTH=163 /DNA_ID=CAMNT_0043879503 /DNA_START=163 /DNA_END=654 /DNA_ORIENTATION=-
MFKQTVRTSFKAPCTGGMRCNAPLRAVATAKLPSKSLCGSSRHVRFGTSRSSYVSRTVRMAAADDSEKDFDLSDDELIDIDEKYDVDGEIDLRDANAFMIKGETEFLDKAAENSAVRETLEALESARVAEVEVLGQAWDLLAKLGAKRPSEGPGSQPKEPKQD